MVHGADPPPAGSAPDRRRGWVIGTGRHLVEDPLIRATLRPAFPVAPCWSETGHPGGLDP